MARIVVVGGDPSLTEAVCARLRRTDEYIPVIEAPIERLPQYGLFQNDCITAANAIKAHNPDVVFFAGVGLQIADELCKSLPGLKPVVFDVFDPLLLQSYVRLREHPTDWWRLVDKNPSSASCDLFAVEGEFGFPHVVAANLAVAHRGRIVVLPSVGSDDVDGVKEDLRSWANSSGQTGREVKERILENLRRRLPSGFLSGGRIKSVSFLTRGLPYGIIPLKFPTTHFFTFPMLGVGVLNGMLKSKPLLRCPVVVLIDPNLVGESEFHTLQTTFKSSGYVLRTAFGTGATVQSAKYLCQYLPSDFLFISTHCGEVSGKRVVERFRNRNNGTHEICYDLALSICPSPRTEEFEVETVVTPIAMDRVLWSDTDGKKLIGAGELLEDFIAHQRRTKNDMDSRDVLSSVDTNQILGSDALQMTDFNFFPLVPVVGGYHHPAVVNNACSSWH